MDKPLQDSSQAKSKFLVDMSREIQMTMKDIMSHSDQVKKTDLSVRQEEHINAIYTSAQKLSWIVNDIMDFSQLESGKVELQSIDFDLEYLINDIFKKTVTQKKDHPVDTYIDIDKNVPLDLIGDPTRLRQVLANLLSNAFRFTLQGEVGIVIRIADGPPLGAASKDDQVYLKISVKDTGKGIPKDKVDSIFELHGQGTPEESWKFGGTGLGLAICKLVIEAMGGTIDVETEEGTGSTFTVNLAFTKGTSLRNRKVYPLEKQDLVGKKAIIVDDNEIARKILNKCCQTMGIEPVLISASPNEVLQMLNSLSDDEQVPDLLLCDIMMPEMDGYELIRKIRTNKRFDGIRTIAVTSAVRVGGARNAQESGFNGFLPKPVFLDEIAKVISTVLGDERAESTIVTRHMAEELKFKGTKVLIIEKEKMTIKLIEECLDLLDCERGLASNGQEAVDRLKEKVYNLCLLNVQTFQDEGPEIVKTIKEISQNLPVIALVTEETKSHRAELSEAGIDDFLLKPVDMISLKRIIKRYGKA